MRKGFLAALVVVLGIVARAWPENQVLKAEIAALKPQ
jgi:hypothetical protein